MAALQPCKLLLVGGLVLFRSQWEVRAAEPGDFDGDGRVSIADVLHRVQGFEPAPGSLDGFEQCPPIGENRKQGFDTSSFEAGLVYLEYLRRSVPDPLPHFIHLIDAWNFRSDPSPLEADVRIHVSLAPMEAPGGTDDRFLMTVRLETSV